MNQPLYRADQYIELALRECGKEKCIPNKIFSYTPKNYHLFHLVIQGKGHFSINGKKYNLHAGSLFYIPPSTKAEYHPDKDDPWTYIWLGFDGSNAQLYLSSIDVSLDKPVIFLNGQQNCQKSLEKLYKQYQEVGFLDLLTLSYGYEFFAYLLAYKNKELSIPLLPNEKIINAAKEFIINNYQFPITIQDIANSLNITPNYLAHVFKHNLKQSPKTYLTNFRMEKARLLLLSNGYNIKTVAGMVGYPNQLHFSNAFKKIYEVSPLTYKQDLEFKGDKL